MLRSSRKVKASPKLPFLLPSRITTPIRHRAISSITKTPERTRIRLTPATVQTYNLHQQHWGASWFSTLHQSTDPQAIERESAWINIKTKLKNENEALAAENVLCTQWVKDSYARATSRKLILYGECSMMNVMFR